MQGIMRHQSITDKGWISPMMGWRCLFQTKQMVWNYKSTIFLNITECQWKHCYLPPIPWWIKTNNTAWCPWKIITCDRDIMNVLWHLSYGREHVVLSELLNTIYLVSKTNKILDTILFCCNHPSSS